jgi:hypothetical protein
MPVLDLLAGPTHAAARLPAHRLADTIGGTQTAIPTPTLVAAPAESAAAAVGPPPPPQAPAPAPAAVPEAQEDPGQPPQAWMRSYRTVRACLADGATLAELLPGALVIDGEDPGAWLHQQRQHWPALSPRQKALLSEIAPPQPPSPPATPRDTSAEPAPRAATARHAAPHAPGGPAAEAELIAAAEPFIGGALPLAAAAVSVLSLLRNAVATHNTHTLAQARAQAVALAARRLRLPATPEGDRLRAALDAYRAAAGGSTAAAAPHATPAAPAGPAGEQAPGPAPAARRRPAGHESAELREHIRACVHAAMTAHHGDVDAAKAALVKSAIPDVMELFRLSRKGGRYEHSEFPPTADILKKTSQKGADQVWEGRPQWRNTEFIKTAKAGPEPVTVWVLDANAAYLSAMTTRLPIGKLERDTSGVHDPKKSGVHLVEPPAWDHSHLPNPIGNRHEPGPLWITEPTLRLLLECAANGLCDAPVIRESLTSGGTEVLLRKMRAALAQARKEAIANDDEVTLEYVKFMYSKFVSTIGESTANRDLRRTDWMHIIRAQSFANLWRRAHKAHSAGLTVVEMSGTDELQVSGGDWRTVFPEGTNLHEFKEKTDREGNVKSYTLGGR